MDREILSAKRRSLTGRKVKALRKQNLLPGNVYGKKIKSLAVEVNASEFAQVFKKAGETNLVTLVIKNGKAEERAVLIANLQKNPVTDAPIHIDFHQVDLKEKVGAKVPVEIEGEAPAEKRGLGTLVQYVNELEVEALPTDLPDRFVVDVSGLSEVDQAVLLKDLPIAKDKIELKADPKTILVKVEPPQKEEEVAPPTPAEGEVSAEEAPAAEGAEAPAGEEVVQEPKDEKTAEE